MDPNFSSARDIPHDPHPGAYGLRPGGYTPVPEHRPDSGLLFLILAAGFSGGLMGFGFGLAFASHVIPFFRGLVG